MRRTHPLDSTALHIVTAQSHVKQGLASLQLAKDSAPGMGASALDITCHSLGHVMHALDCALAAIDLHGNDWESG